MRIGPVAFAGEMLYVGTELPAIKYAGTTEPALLNPELPVADGEGGSVSFKYWPYYHELSPQARYAYVRWLAGGRRESSADIGCVFLFFYGLERRLIHDRVMFRGGEEREQLLDEVRRLRKLYAASASFRGYADRLLDLAVATSFVPIDGAPSEPLPDMLQASAVLGSALKLRLGEFAAKGIPIPAGWALAWVYAHPEIRLRTPSQRCPAEFQKLFRYLYEQEHGNGIKVRPNKTPVVVDYSPASASFGGSIQVDTPSGVPDITSLSKPTGQLQALTELCETKLEPYSRWLGRNAESRHAVEGVALLPPELVADAEHPGIVKIRVWVAERLGNSTSALVRASDLVELWWEGDRESVDRRSATSLVSVLDVIGAGIEPDVRFGGPTPREISEVVIFRLGSEKLSSPGVAYRGAQLLLELAMMVTLADGAAAEEELRLIRVRLGEHLGLSAAEKGRLEAHVAWLRVSPPRFTGLKRRIGELDETQKSEVGQFLIAIAAADGSISPEEVKVLERVYPLLGLDPADLFSHIHSFETTLADEPSPRDPVTVREGSVKQSGALLPSPPASDSDSPRQRGAVKLDPSRIREKVQETAAVAALLGSVFADEESVPLERSRPDMSTPADAAARGTTPQVELLALVGAKEKWDRRELEAFAAERGMLLDGALEALNEAALDKCGQSLFEGEDPVEVSLEVWKELAP